jgi:allantoinase
MLLGHVKLVVASISLTLQTRNDGQISWSLQGCVQRSAAGSPKGIMNDYDLVVRGIVVTENGEARRAIAVRDGAIAAIEDFDASLDATEARTLADDEVLIPGIVDSHVHINEPGRTEWEGFASATSAAAAGGVTTVIDMPLNSIPPTVSTKALETKRSAATDQVRVDVGFWGGAIPSSLGSLRSLHEAGAFGFKCFLSPSGVDEFPALDTEQLNLALDELADFDGLLIVHAEDPTVLDAHANAGGTGYHSFVASRPPEAEVAAIEHVIAGVRRTGGRAHILHVSSAATLPLIRAAKAEGLRLTAETCPHYLTIAEEQIPDGGTQFKCCPPIRDEHNRDLLWEGLLDGTLDLVVTDHSPSTAELKFAHHGDFGLAWGGIAGLQLGLAAVWTEARRRGVPLSSVLGWMSGATARLVGLDQKGKLEVGADADLVVLAPDATFAVDAHALLHKNPVSAYDGRELRGVVRETYLRGVPVVLDAPAGRLLVRP